MTKHAATSAVAGTALQTALAHHRAGRLREAEAGYRALLAREPNDAHALRLLGVLLLGRGEAMAAAGFFEQAIRQRPGMIEAYLGLGNALAAQGKMPEAVEANERALAIDPKNLEALNNLGNVFQAMRRFAEAEAALRRALAINPGLAELHNNLGNALQALKRSEEAMAAYREAIRLRPAFPEAHSNLGNMLKAANRLEEALAAYGRALELNPNYADALNNLGNTLYALGRPVEAVAAYRRSREAQPAQGDAYFYEALARLAMGELAEGFALYEHRWRSELRGARRECPQPLWLGEQDPRGRTFLLHAEQGLGDTIQFARYVTLLAARGAVVHLEVQPALKPLLSGLAGVRSVIARGEPLPDFELHCPLLSLPHAFRTTLENVPAQTPYLAASAERVAEWRRRLPPGGKLRVGLVWAGNPYHKNDHNRSLRLAALRPWLEMANVEFHSLQKEYRSPEERAQAKALGIADWSEAFTDFEETAAAMTALDLVISVDTSTAHLAGALGRPTWVLLPFAPDWRWMLERADSPWYPNARLFRQERAGDWAEPTAAVAAKLAAWVAGQGEGGRA